jgi:hypothetical protein
VRKERREGRGGEGREGEEGGTGCVCADAAHVRADALGPRGRIDLPPG